MAIPANISQLKKAFHKHCNTAKTGKSSSHYLLLFYAVECGLKSKYLAQNGWRSTSEIIDPKLKQSHDLKKFAQAVKAPASIIGYEYPVFQLKKDTSKMGHQVKDIHQVWRYGIKLNKNRDEEAIVRWLNNLKEWLEEEI